MKLAKFIPTRISLFMLSSTPGDYFPNLTAPSWCTTPQAGSHRQHSNGFLVLTKPSFRPQARLYSSQTRHAKTGDVLLLSMNKPGCSRPASLTCGVRSLKASEEALALWHHKHPYTS